MDLTQLKKEIAFQWRVQSFHKTKHEATCVAYIDARDVANILDEVCGPENWQDEYKTVGDMLFAGIGIRVGQEWVWKWDTGSESNIEKEKGHVSDSFKRAAVKWGVGRFLYDLPIQKVKATAPGSQYRDVVDDNGNKVWDLTKHVNGMMKRPQNKPAPAPKTEAAPPQQHKPAEKKLTDSQRKQLMAIYGNAPRDERLADANGILLAVKPDMKPVTSFSELTERQAAYLIKQLEQMRAA